MWAPLLFPLMLAQVKNVEAQSLLPKSPIPTYRPVQTNPDCETSLLRETIIFDQNPLRITSKRVYWRGRRLGIASHFYDGADLRRWLLLAMVHRQNSYLSYVDFIEDLSSRWPNLALASGQTLIVSEMLYLRKLFRKLDSEFTHIRGWKWYGFAWDTGARPDLSVRGDAEYSKGMLEIRWRGQPVTLTFRQALAVLTLLENREAVSQQRLFRAAYFDRERDNLSASEISKLMRDLISGVHLSFRRVDRSFGAIQTSHDGNSYLWTASD